MSVICSQHLSLFQRIYHTFSVSWTKDSCSLHKKLQATKICSFKDDKIWKFCHHWKNHTSSYWWTDQNYTEKGKAHGHFYSSALISIRSDLPAVLIFLFDFFLKMELNFIFLVKFVLIFLLLAIFSKSIMYFYLFLMFELYIWLQSQNLSLDFHYHIFTSCF